MKTFSRSYPKRGKKGKKVCTFIYVWTMIIEKSSRSFRASKKNNRECKLEREIQGKCRQMNCLKGVNWKKQHENCV